MRRRLLTGLLAAALVACQGSDPETSDRNPLALTAVSFNTGTTEAKGGSDPYDGYGEAEAATSDAWYGDGLAWLPVVEDTARWLTDHPPDVIAFQEIFWSGECPAIPVEHHAGWVCEGWQPGDPTVAEVILGPDYQIACNVEKPDKCLAVHRDFGTFEGCDDSVCLDHLDGVEVDGCGSGSRVGRGRIALADGGTLNAIGVHGTSGLTPEDRDCRAAQFTALFDELLDDGAPNLVLGDFNTDPGRNADFDVSAQRLVELADAHGLAFLTEVGPEAEPTYSGLFNIDHVLGDTFDGACTADFGVTGVTYFDHVPIVCDLSTPTR